jgi:small subunit ribosomal protein S2
MTNEKTVNKDVVEALFKTGAHFGYSKSRRHPSITPFIFGIKNKIEIFDLEKTYAQLEEAKTFIEELGFAGKQILFVAGKREAMRHIKDHSEKIDQPYVSGRWIGGTLTNFEEIQKRVSRFEKLSMEKTKGLLAKYTKKERLLIDREIDKLSDRFGGITNMKSKPAAVFIVDVKREENAVAEAKLEKIPVITLSNSDCDISGIQFPILGNDGSVATINYILGELVAAYQAGVKRKKSAPTPATATK